MSSIIGNVIVIGILAVILFFSGRHAFKIFRNELKGGGCSCCSGNCSCASCGSKKKS
ncbi:FeoB-associated Cys-rich membrane protein [Butyrivibrio proteoclasticus]|uniref:FeoB-associated Cys-rich membrane protein n=1 Tax=Butyrivibrio proteoclasticus TaxID=43305 RepID=UPI000A3DE148|nr:FeoB-associated Cys-rich membrane protein [Butyrivibrio proteoclasticus]